MVYRLVANIDIIIDSYNRDLRDGEIDRFLIVRSNIL